MKFFVFWFFVCALFCCGVLSDDSWDYLVFTQEWPGTFCLYTDCDFPPQTVDSWNIHGLWPSNSEGKDPFYCEDAPPFDINKLTSIYDKLLIDWANLKEYNDPKDFWGYEWKKHGTCAIEDPIMPDELSYFSSSLRLKNRTSIQQILKNSGVVPSDDTSYYESMITDAIRQSLKITPKLSCVRYNGDLYLNQIEICSDKSFKFINCPKRRHNNVNLAKSLVSDIFQNIRSELSNTPSRPINEPCSDNAFYLPIITKP